MRFGLASKFPQINTIKVLVHKSFELVGFSPSPSGSVRHGIASWLGGEFCEKMKFVVFEMLGLDLPLDAPK